VVKATTLYSPNVVSEAIGFAVSSARNPEGDGFHEGKGQFKVRMPTVLIDHSNIDRYINKAF
jgi:hypothetical protein